MKKLTQEHIKQLLLNHIITFKTPSNATAIGNSIFVTKNDIKKYSSNYPLDVLQTYIQKTTTNNEVIETKGYLVPDYYKKLLVYYTPELLPQVKEFDELAKQLNSIPRTNHQQISDATVKLHNSGMNLANALYMNNLSCDILSSSFWSNIDNKYNEYPSKIPAIAEMLYQSFEDEKDVIKFQSILPTTNLASKNLQYTLQYKTFVKALQLVPDYSLQDVPKILEHILLHEKNEPLKIETAKALKKYDFNITKDLYLQAYAASSYKRLNKLLKTIIDGNNALDNQDQLFIEEKNNVVHTSKITINFITLKNQVNDNTLLAETLIAIIVEASKSKYRDLEYVMSENSQQIHLFAESYDKVQIENFKHELLQKIEFATSDVYLDEARYTQLNNHFRGRRTIHESNKKVLNDFNELFAIYKLKTDLEKELPASTNKVVRRKI